MRASNKILCHAKTSSKQAHSESASSISKPPNTQPRDAQGSEEVLVTPRPPQAPLVHNIYIQKKTLKSMAFKHVISVKHVLEHMLLRHEATCS